MKRQSIFNIIAVLFLASIFSVACTKKNSEVRLSPKLSTSQVLSVTSDSATVVGFVIAQGSGFQSEGVCYDTTAHPTVDNNKVLYQGDHSKATFHVVLSGLHYATKYYVRAFAVTSTGPIYGEEYSLTTLPVVPTLTTDTINADSITGNSAVGGGNVTIGGGATVTARGVCFGTSHNPTTSDNKTVDGKGTGTFASKLTGLKGNTTYYVRAYATNSAGTGYGPEVSFKTLVDFPQVTTQPVTDITKTSAVSGDSVTYDGGGTITEHGIVWSTSADPTINDNKIVNPSDTVYSDTITGLTKNTTYHVRAYAINSAGVGYGNDISFTTLADITKFWVVGDYNGWDNSDAAKYIISTPTSNGEAEGYVWLKAGGIKLTTDHSWKDPYTFGDDGTNTGKLANPGNNITVPSDGYYLIRANQKTMTYTLIKTTWGVIGDATPTGWGSQTDMVYDATSGTFHLALHLTSGGSFKFRGTSDWNINYGSDNADGTLQAGGGNIPVTVDGDYYITLDLSHPNAYTYSANRWGLIGDATPGGWGTSTPMTWDATNQCMTVTVDLVAGSYKFRANDAWTVNLGGTTTDLTQDGGNLSIATAGNYTIQLFLSGTPHCTVTKN